MPEPCWDPRLRGDAELRRDFFADLLRSASWVSGGPSSPAAARSSRTRRTATSGSCATRGRRTCAVVSLLGRSWE
eukprot:7003805-Pyramimonas_sp.AAC.1